MPRTVTRGTRGAGVYKGIAGFMDLKKAFNDAMTKMRWEKEKLMFTEGRADVRAARGQRGATTRSLIGAGFTPTDVPGLLAGGQTGFEAPSFTPKDIGEGFVRIGRKIVKGERPSKFQLQKEARITVNAMINQNPHLQMEVWKDPNVYTERVEAEVKRLTRQFKGEVGEDTQKITVRRKSDGQIGQLSSQYFDPAIYERIE